MDELKQSLRQVIAETVPAEELDLEQAYQALDARFNQIQLNLAKGLELLELVEEFENPSGEE